MTATRTYAIQQPEDAVTNRSRMAPTATMGIFAPNPTRARAASAWALRLHARPRICVTMWEAHAILPPASATIQSCLTEPSAMMVTGARRPIPVLAVSVSALSQLTARIPTSVGIPGFASQVQDNATTPRSLTEPHATTKTSARLEMLAKAVRALALPRPARRLTSVICQVPAIPRPVHATILWPRMVTPAAMGTTALRPTPVKAAHARAVPSSAHRRVSATLGREPATLLPGAAFMRRHLTGRNAATATPVLRPTYAKAGRVSAAIRWYVALPRIPVA